MAVFRELRGINIKFLSSNPEKAHPCAEPRCLAYYAWKSVQAYRLYVIGRTPKKKPSKHFDAQFRAYGEKKPLEVSRLNFAVDRYPGRNYVCNFLWRSIKGFGRGKGSNFQFSHWLASSTLQHSRTTVRVCDNYSPCSPYRAYLTSSLSFSDSTFSPSDLSLIQCFNPGLNSPVPLILTTGWYLPDCLHHVYHCSSISHAHRGFSLETSSNTYSTSHHSINIKFIVQMLVPFLFYW